MLVECWLCSSLVYTSYIVIHECSGSSIVGRHLRTFHGGWLSQVTSCCVVYTTSSETVRYVFWVAKYAHLLLPYFDYFLCDGSHGFSSHGWKYIPLCVKTSGGSIVPLSAVWGLEEETTSLLKMVALLRQHCEAHGVDASAFTTRDAPQVKPLAACLCALTIFAQETLAPDAHAKAEFRTFAYHPKWEKFFICAMDEATSDEALLALLPIIVEKPTLHCDSGTALISLTRHLQWERTACAKHLEPNVASLNGNLKPLAMTLLYALPQVRRQVSALHHHPFLFVRLTSGKRRSQNIGMAAMKKVAHVNPWLSAPSSLHAPHSCTIHTCGICAN